MAQHNDTTPLKLPSSRLPVRYINRDLSWLKFNERVLDQIGKSGKTFFESLMFLHIGASNLDEFFEIRVGRLYNYVDHDTTQFDKLDPSLLSFRKKLLRTAKKSFEKQHAYFLEKVQPLCAKKHFTFARNITSLKPQEQNQLNRYFKEVIFPTLTPITFDNAHTLPILKNKSLVFGVVTHDPTTQKSNRQITFIQLPQHLPRFYRLIRARNTFFVPIEEVLRKHLSTLFADTTILSVTLFRIIRNGDLSLEGSNNVEISFVEELKKKLKRRNRGRVVRLEVEENYDSWLLSCLKSEWDIGQENVFEIPTQSLIDFTGLQQLVQQGNFESPLPGPPISCPAQHDGDLFEVLKKQDILLHHPYNSIDIVINFIERAAEDPYVTTIKMTIYRLAPNSAVTAALLKAAAYGKHVSVIIEIKARFDEEYNMREAKRLEKGGCFVSYEMSSVKIHAKMMLIERKEKEHVTRYVHLSTGNYNEETAKRYADVSLLTTDAVYAHDVSKFFDILTGHSIPQTYKNIIAMPFSIRDQLTELIRQEAQNAQRKLPCGIVIKVNALEDETTIEELYKASQAGVPIRLIVRGICCLIPQRLGISTNIEVRSIVGNFLEHARIFYFHNQGDAKVCAGSADIMLRSFNKRIESLFFIRSPILKQQTINILAYDLRDNVNSYLMQGNGTYVKVMPGNMPVFNIHKTFFKLTLDEVMKAQLFA